MRWTQNFLRNLTFVVTLLTLLVIVNVGCSVTQNDQILPVSGSLPSSVEKTRQGRQVLLNPEYSYELVEETVEDEEESPPEEETVDDDAGAAAEDEEEEEEIEVEVDDEEFEKYARYASTHPENFRFGSSPPMMGMGRQINVKQNNRQGHRYPSNDELSVNNNNQHNLRQGFFPSSANRGKDQQHGQKNLGGGVVSVPSSPAGSLIPGGFQPAPNKRNGHHKNGPDPGKISMQNFNRDDYDYYEQQRQKASTNQHQNPFHGGNNMAPESSTKQRTINTLNQQKMETPPPPTKKAEPMKLTRESIRAREHLKFTVTPRSTTTSTTLKTTEPFSTVKPTAVQITHVIPRVRVQTAQPPIVEKVTKKYSNKSAKPSSPSSSSVHRKNGVEQNKKVYGSAEVRSKNFGTTQPFRNEEQGQNVMMTPTRSSFTQEIDKKTQQVVMTTPSFGQNLDKNLLKRQFQVSPSPSSKMASQLPPKMVSPSPTPSAGQSHVSRLRGSAEKYGHSIPTPLSRPTKEEIARVTMMTNFGPSQMPPGWSQNSQLNFGPSPSFETPLQNLNPHTKNIAKQGLSSSSEIRSKNKNMASNPVASSSEKKLAKSPFEKLPSPSPTARIVPTIRKGAPATQPPSPSPSPSAIPESSGDKQLILTMPTFTPEEEKKIEELRREFEQEEALARQKMRTSSMERGHQMVQGPFDQFKSHGPSQIPMSSSSTSSRSREIGQIGKPDHHLSGSGEKSRERKRKGEPNSKGKKKANQSSRSSEVLKSEIPNGQLNHQKLSSHENLGMRPFPADENKRLIMPHMTSEQMMTDKTPNQNGPSSTEQRRQFKVKAEENSNIYTPNHHPQPTKLPLMTMTADLSKESWQGQPPPKMQGVPGDDQFGPANEKLAPKGPTFGPTSIPQIQFTTSPPSFFGFTTNQRPLIEPQSPSNVAMMGSESSNPPTLISHQRSQHGHQEQRPELLHSSFGPPENLPTFETPSKISNSQEKVRANQDLFFSPSPTQQQQHQQQQGYVQQITKFHDQQQHSRAQFGQQNFNQMDQQFRSTERTIDPFELAPPPSPTQNQFSQFLSTNRPAHNLVTVPPTSYYSQPEGRMPLLQTVEADLHASPSIASVQFVASPGLSIRHHSLEGVMTANQKQQQTQPQPQPSAGPSDEEKKQQKILMDRQAEFESKFEMENLRIREQQGQFFKNIQPPPMHSGNYENGQKILLHHGPTQQPWRDEPSNGKAPPPEHLSTIKLAFESTREPMQVRMPLVNENVQRDAENKNSQWMRPSPQSPSQIIPFVTTIKPPLVENGHYQNEQKIVPQSNGPMGQEMRPEFSQFEPEEVMPPLPPPHGKKQLENRQDIFEVEQQSFSSHHEKNDTKFNSPHHHQQQQQIIDTMPQATFHHHGGPQLTENVQPIEDHHDQNLRVWSSTLQQSGSHGHQFQPRPIEEVPADAVPHFENVPFNQQNFTKLSPFEEREDKIQKITSFGQQLVGASSMGPTPQNEFIQHSQSGNNNPPFEPMGGGEIISNTPQFQANAGDETSAFVQPIMDAESSEEILQSMQRRPSPVEIAEELKMMQARQKFGSNEHEKVPDDHTKSITGPHETAAAPPEFSNVDDYPQYGPFNGPSQLSRMSYPAQEDPMNPQFDQNMAGASSSGPLQPQQQEPAKEISFPVPSFITPEEMIHSFPPHQTADNQPGQSWNPSETVSDHDDERKSQLYEPSFGPMQDEMAGLPSNYGHEEKILPIQHSQSQPQPQQSYGPMGSMMYEQQQENVDNFAPQFGHDMDPSSSIQENSGFGSDHVHVQPLEIRETFNSRQKIMEPTPQLLATQERMQAFNNNNQQSSPSSSDIVVIPAAKSVQAGPIIELFEMGRDIEEYPYEQSPSMHGIDGEVQHDQLDPSVKIIPPPKSPAIQKQQRRRRIKGASAAAAAAASPALPEGRRRRRPKNKETVRPIIIRKKDPSESSRLKLGSRITRKIAESRLANGRQKGGKSRSKSSSASSMRPKEEKEAERESTVMQRESMESSKDIENLAPSPRKVGKNKATGSSRVKGTRKPAQKFKKGSSTSPPKPTQAAPAVSDKPSRRKGSSKNSEPDEMMDEQPVKNSRPVSNKKIKSAPVTDNLSKNSRRSSTKSSSSSSSSSSRRNKKSEIDRPNSSSIRKLGRTSSKITVDSAVIPVEISSTTTPATTTTTSITTTTTMATLSRRRQQVDTTTNNNPVPIPISLEISVENLAMNEENMELSLDFYLKQSWTVQGLKYENLDFQFNDTHHENSNKGWNLLKSNGDLNNVHQNLDEKACKPIKILTNSKGLNSPTTIDTPSYKISQISMTLSCPMTYNSFPMDSQIFHVDLHHFNLQGHHDEERDDKKFEFQWKSFRFISDDEGDHHEGDLDLPKYSKLYPLQLTGYRLKNETTTTVAQDDHQNHGGVWKTKFEPNENLPESASSFEILLKRPLKSFYQLRIFLPPSLVVTLGLSTLFFGNHRGVPRLAVTVAGILGFVLIAIWGGGGGLNLPPDAHSTIKMGDIFSAACFLTILLCFIVSLLLFWLERKRRKLKKFNEMYKINKLAADKLQKREQGRRDNVLGKILVDAENGFQRKQTKCEGWLRRIDLSSKILLPTAFLVFNISYWIYCLEFMGVEKKRNLYW